MEKRYRALRTIGAIYKILGIIAGIVTLLVVIGFCATSVLGGAFLDNVGREFGQGSGGFGFFSGLFGGIIGSIFAIIYGGGFALTLYAFGEGVDLAISIEENTRASASLLSRLQTSFPPPVEN